VISTVTDLLAEALFASDLQPSRAAYAEAVRAAATRPLLRHGSDGCAAVVATEFGDHPDTAVRRMIWARRTLTTVYLPLTPPREVQLTA
jgi:hypothetical protein